jgi:virulence-associated protein VapD
MYAVAFDLVVADAERYHPKGMQQAYADIGEILAARGFTRVQGSLYLTDDENMANLFMAMQELRARPWFRKSVRDIRAFRIEQWSDFTAVVKGVRPPRPLGVREPDAVYAA